MFKMSQNISIQNMNNQSKKNSYLRSFKKGSY